MKRSSGRPQQRPAEAALAALDPIWAELIEAHGPCTLRRRRQAKPFAELVRVVVAQRVSTKAAATVTHRLTELLGGAATSEAVLATPTHELRGVGLPARKVLALQALAQSVTEGSLPLTRLGRWSNPRIEAALCAIPGIGPWTAQVFMIFSLARPDVFPAADLGLQEGIRVAFRLSERPSARATRLRAEAWAPYRSTAAWYLWRAGAMTPEQG